MSNLVLPRAVRNAIRNELRALPGWEAYREANGLKSNALTKGEVKAAAAALGYDLHEAAARLLSSLPAADLVTAANESDEGDEMHPNQIEDARIEALAAGVVKGAGSTFEGRSADDLIAEALAPAGAHLTPHAMGMLPALLRPLAEAAAQGPRVVREVVHMRPAGAWQPPSVNVLRWEPAAKPFGMTKGQGGAGYRTALQETLIAVCDHAGAPRIDPDYVWQPDILACFAAHDAKGKNLWTFGPAGTGKTEASMQYAARTHRPFVRIAIDGTTEPVELIGQEMPAKAGGMEWVDGKLTKAFRTPYCVILIDEPSLLKPSTLAVFQTALDTRELYLPTGERVDAAQGIFIVAADNTAGCGDDSGRYAGTDAMNAAFMDRFGMKLEFAFLPADKEALMLSHRAGLPAPACRIMVDYANLTRQKADAGSLTMGVTPRRLLSWASMVTAGIASAKAFVGCVVNGAAPEDKEALLMLEQSSLGSQHDTIDQHARGTFKPAPAGTPTVEPLKPSETGLKFKDDPQV